MISLDYIFKIMAATNKPVDYYDQFVYELLKIAHSDAFSLLVLSDKHSET